jgi:ABC-type sugar transport system substrate-binding protein
MVKAQQGKTVALLFDSLVSPFWVAGLDIMRVKAKENGWTVLEGISNFDDNKQFEQVKAMIARKVDGILIIQTDSKAVIPAIRAANAAPASRWCISTARPPPPTPTRSPSRRTTGK